jgi:O-antigen/teichoic acid export membrane protein
MAVVRGPLTLRAPAGRAPDPLFRSAYALVVSTGVTSALGLAYWVAAARAYPERALGEASAVISAMLMLSNFAQLNLFYGLVRFVPGAGRRAGVLIARSYAASAAAALVLGTAFALVAPHVSEALASLHGAVYAVGFVAAVVLWGVFALQDGVLTALRRATWVPIENALFGAVKLGLLLAFASLLPNGGIFASWSIPVLLAVVPVNVLIFRVLLSGRRTAAADGAEPPITGVVRFVAVDYAGALLLQTYTTALPLLIVALLGAEANAAFYVAYVIVAALDLVATNVATSMVAEASRDPSRLAEYARRVLLRSAALVAPAVAVLFVAAPLVAGIFGAAYADDSASVLRVLALGSLPRLVNTVYMNVMRVERHVGRVVGVQAATSVIAVSVTVALAPRMGVEGVAVAWTAAHTAVALARVPWLVRVLRPAAGARA